MEMEIKNFINAKTKNIENIEESKEDNENFSINELKFSII